MRNFTDDANEPATDNLSRPEKTVTDTETPEEKPKRSYKGVVFGLIFLALVTALTLIIIFQFNDISETFTAIGNADGLQLFFALLCLLGYIAIWPIGLCIFSKIKKTKSTFAESYLIGASEHFFNGVTPFQTGAQPFQVYSYARSGVKAGTATGMVMVNFISLLIASNILVVLSMIFAADFFGSFYENGMLWIPILGITMNAFSLFSFIVIVTCNWVRVLLVRIMTWLCKIKFIGKFLTKSIPRFDDYCVRAQEASKDIFSNLSGFLLAVLTKVIGLIFYYSVPFFVLRALGVDVDGGQFIYSLLATAFCINAIVFMPTPGTAGGIEYAFTILFVAVFSMTGSQAAAGAILWRGLTYYLLILISFVQHLFLELLLKRKERNKKQLDMPLDT